MATDNFPCGTPGHEGQHQPASLLTTTLSYPQERTVLCTVTGEVDLATAPVLLEQLQKAMSDGPRYLIVDLSAVTFFGAAGVRLLDEARAARGEEHEVVLVSDDRLVARVLQICDVNYRRYSDRYQALADCGRNTSS